MTVPYDQINQPLVRFLLNLHDIHCDVFYGNGDESLQRCLRWMDTVLPPEEVEAKEVEAKGVIFPYGLNKAAE